MDGQRLRCRQRPIGKYKHKMGEHGMSGKKPACLRDSQLEDRLWNSIKLKGF